MSFPLMDCPIIPAPIRCVHQDGQLDIGSAVAITCRGDCQGVGDFLAAYLRDRLSIAARLSAVRWAAGAMELHGHAVDHA